MWALFSPEMLQAGAVKGLSNMTVKGLSNMTVNGLSNMTVVHKLQLLKTKESRSVESNSRRPLTSL